MPLLLAPMAEISHRALREIIAGFGGCDEYHSEMISAGALLNGGPFEKWYLDAGPEPHKLVYQLVSHKAEHLANAAALLDGHECAGIDINMGCCAPGIVSQGGGVRWMESIERSAEMIRQVRRRTKRRLSVKLRIGFADDFAYLVKFCRALETEGVERITLHPRTAREKFKRGCRWQYVPALREELGIPVAGNGDIASAAELNEKSALCDAVMIGRLAVQKPWVFAEARALPLPESIDLWEIAARFLELLALYQPAEFRASRARRFFNYFCNNLKWANHVKTLLARETEPAAMARVIGSFFAENPEERTVRPALEGQGGQNAKDAAN